MSDVVLFPIPCIERVFYDYVTYVLYTQGKQA